MCHPRFRDGVDKALAERTDADTHVAQFPHLFINVVSEASAQLYQHISNCQSIYKCKRVTLKSS